MEKYWPNIMNYCCGKKTLPGFTVLELLVGMIVSAIVLGTIFSAWHIVSKQAVVYEERAAYTRELSLGQSLLLRDCSSADSLQTTDGSEVRCYQKIKGEVQLNVLYKIDGNELMRITSFSHDTFPLPDNFSFTNTVSL